MSCVPPPTLSCVPPPTLEQTNSDTVRTWYHTHLAHNTYFVPGIIKCCTYALETLPTKTPLLLLLYSSTRDTCEARLTSSQLAWWRIVSLGTYWYCCSGVLVYQVYVQQCSCTVFFCFCHRDAYCRSLSCFVCHHGRDFRRRAS